MVLLKKEMGMLVKTEDAKTDGGEEKGIDVGDVRLERTSKDLRRSDRAAKALQMLAQQSDDRSWSRREGGQDRGGDEGSTEFQVLVFLYSIAVATITSLAWWALHLQRWGDGAIVLRRRQA